MRQKKSHRLQKEQGNKSTGIDDLWMILFKDLYAQSSGAPFLSEAINLFLIFQLHVQLVVRATSAIATKNADGATREEHNPLQLLVIKKVVEGPQAALFTKRIRVQIWVVAVNVTALQVDLLVEGVPQLGSHRVEFLSHRREKAAVHCIYHPVEAGLSAELVGPCGAEVIVRPEGLVERGDEVEQSLPADLVAQRVLTVLAALPQLRGAGGAGGLRGRKGFQDVWLPLLAELLKHVFIISCHLAGVALDPAKDARLPRFNTQPRAEGFKAGVFQQFHGGQQIIFHTGRQKWI